MLNGTGSIYSHLGTFTILILSQASLHGATIPLIRRVSRGRQRKQRVSVTTVAFRHNQHRGPRLRYTILKRLRRHIHQVGVLGLRHISLR